MERHCAGYCTDCEREHVLSWGNARTHALALMETFERQPWLDDLSSNPHFLLDDYFPKGRGNMFGVLECRDSKGEIHFLRAFSSLHEGIRNIDGWVPNILPEWFYEERMLPDQLEIKRLTKVLRTFPEGSPERLEFENQRRDISRALMDEMHGAYQLANFRGEVRSLAGVFPKELGLPGGVCECCAPKLLHEAALRGWHPLGIAEFFWGREHERSGTFYPACRERCQPMLGYLLCGVES